jgi:hypothetical protein
MKLAYKEKRQRERGKKKAEWKKEKQSAAVH